MKKRTGKKKRMRFLILILVICLLGSGTAIFVLRPDWRFRAWDLVNSWFDSVPMERMEYGEEDLAEYSVSDLKREDVLLLINEEYPVSSQMRPSVSQYKDTDVIMAEAAMEPFSYLSEAVQEKTGSTLYVRDSYRSLEEQEVVYQEQPDVAAVPGSSEHMTGLALDVYVAQYAGYGFLKSDAGQLVNQNCWEYGFIIRYPQFRSGDTKIPYEPWHIRYVGRPHAEIIERNNLVLEEYILGMELGSYYSSCGYCISRQSGDRIKMPKNVTQLTVSADNTGNWIITGKEEKTE